MSSIINFASQRGANPRGRLHVGYRKRDWSLVWYGPLHEMHMDEGDGETLAQPDADGTIPLALFQMSSGEHQRREPMEGEVWWLPHFGLPIEESINRKERERLQQQFLHDAWRYLNENDPEAVKALEAELNAPKHRRWQSWFDEAKKWKKTKLRQRAKRRSRRTEQAMASLPHMLIEDPDLTLDGIEITSDTSDDSTYESEEERVPVKKSAPSHSKRKGPPGGDRPDASSKKSKNPRPNNNGKQPDRPDSRHSEESDSGRSMPRFHHPFSGLSSSASSSSGKQLPNYQSWVPDSASTRFNGDMDDEEAFGAAQRNSSAPDDPSTNNRDQDD